MYVRNHHVRNVKLLRDVRIDFEGADGQPRTWTVFVGENRLCKTTLLQTIAATAAGVDRGTQLVTDVVASWPDLRDPQPLSIETEFVMDAERPAQRLRSKLTLEPNKRVFAGASVLDDSDPTWQLRLVPALKKVFPRIQFIATTHSPMILPALAAEEVFLLSHDADGSVVATQSPVSPTLLTGSELYDSFFEIQRLHPSDLGDKTRRYGRLATDVTRSESEDREMRELRAELSGAGVEFDWEPVPREGGA